MKAIEILEKHKKLVWPVVEKYLAPPRFPQSFKIGPKYQYLERLHWRIVRDYPERKGKYLRPTLLNLTAQAMGANINKVLLTAAGMQLSEEWLLIHDDVEDDSTLRRGLPALHQIYGKELAVNAGDHLQALMWKIFNDNHRILGSILTSKIVDEFYTQLTRTTIGQTAELFWAKSKIRQFSDKDWFFIADGKTSYYTVACPMRLGAIIAQANRTQLDKLAQFGIYLGRCFQLIDDVLDLTSSFSGLKIKGNDIYEGKKTVMLGHLYQTADRADKTKLRAIINKRRSEKTAKEVDWVIAKMRQYGSLEYAQRLTGKFKLMAGNYFNQNLKFLAKEPYRSQLQSLIQFIFERRS